MSYEQDPDYIKLNDQIKTYNDNLITIIRNGKDRVVVDNRSYYAGKLAVTVQGGWWYGNTIETFSFKGMDYKTFTTSGRIIACHKYLDDEQELENNKYALEMIKTRCDDNDARNEALANAEILLSTNNSRYYVSDKYEDNDKQSTITMESVAPKIIQSLNNFCKLSAAEIDEIVKYLSPEINKFTVVFKNLAAARKRTIDFVLLAGDNVVDDIGDDGNNDDKDEDYIPDME